MDGHPDAVGEGPHPTDRRGGHQGGWRGSHEGGQGGPGGPGIVVESRGAVRLLRLDRPRRLNALDHEASKACRAFFRAAAEDPEVRVVVVTGSGDRAFCAGFDLSTVSQGAFDEWAASIGGITKDVQFPKPVIAAVNGLAYGGGLELMLACDLRITVPSATFALPEVEHGLIAGGGGTVRLPWQVPWAVAADMLLRGRVLDADEASRFGMVNDVVDPDRLLPTALEWAEDLARRSPLALRLTKQSMWRSRGMGLPDALELEEQYSRQVQHSEEARQGVAAFMARKEKGRAGS